MEDDIITPGPQITPDPESKSAAPADMENEPVRIFDITDDLNISPAEENTILGSLKKPHAPVQPVTSSQTVPSIPVPEEKSPVTAPPTPPVQPPRKPTPIPIQDFSASLEKAKTIHSQNDISATKNRGPVQIPSMEVTNESYPQNPNLKPLRTYESDVAEVLSHKKTSAASIAIAEIKKEEGQERLSNNEESSHAVKKLILAILSLIIVGSGFIGAYYLYSKSPLATVTPQVTTSNESGSLVPSEARKSIPIDNIASAVVLAALRSEMAKPIPPNSILELIPVKTIGGKLSRIPAQDMLSFMKIPAPNIISRSLSQNWMLGIFSDAKGEKTAFVVVTTDFFQNTFAGMLQWESVMADDLKQYLYSGIPAGVANVPSAPSGVQPTVNAFGNIESTLPMTGTSTPPASTTTKPVPTKAAIATTTATTTAIAPAPVLQTYYTVRGQFEDRIVRNKDVRAFRTSDGNVLFLYSFIDNSHLIITGNEATLSEVLSRLDKQAFVR